jgi:hypothetical protein
VNHGRRHLNFSDWAEHSHEADEELGERLENICEEVSTGKMPLGSYLLLHPKAELSGQDIRMICEWTRSEGQRLASQLEKESTSR